MTATSRRPSTAALLSALVPGLGQFYNRQWWKGAAFLIAMVIADAAFNVTADTLLVVQQLMGMNLHAAGAVPPLPSVSSLLLRSVPVLIVVLWSVADARKAALARRTSN